MKKTALLFLVILFTVTYSLHAQKTFAGEVKFETKIDGTDDPNLLVSAESRTQVVSILGNKFKMVMKPHEMVGITQVWDGDKGTSYVLIELTGMGKFFKKWNAEEHKNKMKFSDFSYQYENEYKTICDYKCQKVIATVTNLEDDSQVEYTLYVAKEIGTSKINGSQFVGLEGFPLMTIQSLKEYCDDCVAVEQATKITPKKIKEVDFLLPDDAKSIEDAEPELKEMLKGAFGEE